MATMVTMLAGLLGLGSAEASLKTVEQAYELHLDQVVLPAAVGGQVIVRPCAKCRPISLATSAASRFLVRGEDTPLTLVAFTKAIDAARRAAKPMIYVYYAADTHRVTRIVLGKGRLP